MGQVGDLAELAFAEAADGDGHGHFGGFELWFIGWIGLGGIGLEGGFRRETWIEEKKV